MAFYTRHWMHRAPDNYSLDLPVNSRKMVPSLRSGCAKTDPA